RGNRTYPAVYPRRRLLPDQLHVADALPVLRLAARTLSRTAQAPARDARRAGPTAGPHGLFSFPRTLSGTPRHAPAFAADERHGAARHHTGRRSAQRRRTAGVRKRPRR